MDCWEALYIQALHQQKELITEQQVNDKNPLFEMAKITNIPRLKHSPHNSLHWKQRIHKYMVSNLHSLILVFHILTIQLNLDLLFL